MTTEQQWKPGRRARRVILALLSGAPDLSCYPISRAAQVGLARVALTLARMEELGWAESDWGPETGHGRRRFYRLTARGRCHGMKALGLEEKADDH